VASIVEFNDDTNDIDVGVTTLMAASEDESQLLWDGGVIYPYYRSFTWRSKDLAKSLKGGAYFSNIEIMDYNDMKFTANTENYQVLMFKQV